MLNFVGPIWGQINVWSYYSEFKSDERVCQALAAITPGAAPSGPR
jgi:hypothetical protein